MTRSARTRGQTINASSTCATLGSRTVNPSGNVGGTLIVQSCRRRREAMVEMVLATNIQTDDLSGDIEYSKEGKSLRCWLEGMESVSMRVK